MKKIDLRVGMRLVLPNGNAIRLLEVANREWRCEYLPGSKERGEVHFTEAFLKRAAKVF